MNGCAGFERNEAEFAIPSPACAGTLDRLLLLRGLRVTKLVYIGGFGQSGTTLFEYLLTANPDAVACGEVVNGFQGRSGRELICSCGKSANDCPIWGAFERGSNASWSHDALVLTLLEHVEGKYDVLSDASKTAWGSITAPFRFRRMLGPRFFLLHVVRDPRGVCWSAIRLPQRKTRRKKRPSLTERVLSKPILRCLRTAAGWWVANLSCEFFGRLYPAQYLRLLYEDVAGSPHKALYAVFSAVSPDLSAAACRAWGERQQTSDLRQSDAASAIAICRCAAG